MLLLNCPCLLCVVCCGACFMSNLRLEFFGVCAVSWFVCSVLCDVCRALFFIVVYCLSFACVC